MYRQLCNLDLSVFVVVVVVAVVYRHLCKGTPGHPLVVIRTLRDYIMLPSPACLLAHNYHNVMV